MNIAQLLMNKESNEKRDSNPSEQIKQNYVFGILTQDSFLITL
jgi:hypothetical protein